MRGVCRRLRLAQAGGRALIALVCVSPATGSAFSVAGGVVYFDHSYREFDDTGSQLIEERGRLHGYSIELAKRWPSRIGMSLEYLSSRDAIAYDGSTQSGRTLRTDAFQDFDTLAVSADFRFRAGHWSISPRLGYAHWRWKRRIAETEVSLPLNLRYDWTQLSAGLRLDRDLPWGSVALEWDRLENRGARTLLDLSVIGLGTLTLHPGSGTGNRLALSNSIELSAKWTIAQFVYVETQSFTESPVAGASQGPSTRLFFEPDSETRRVGLGFRIERRLR